MQTTSRRQVEASALTLAMSAFLAVVYNSKFWGTLTSAMGGSSVEKIPLGLAAFAAVLLIFNACLTLVSFRFLIKPIFVALLVATSAAAYFTDQYGVAIDQAMVQNVFETDAREASELLSWKMVLYVGVLGVLPALAVARLDIHFQPPLRGLAIRLAIVAASLAGAAVLLLTSFKTLAPAVREHEELRHLLAPANYLGALNSYLHSQWTTPLPIEAIGTDAHKGPAWAGQSRKTVTVIVVGETARARNFSLNGYARDTNPQLAREHGLINFSQVRACGTSTGTSVPCIFSALGREAFKGNRAHRQEGLLDVLAHAGFGVVWRDNNSGCKGVCDRVVYQDLSRPVAGDRNCRADECYDERLLDGLPELIRSAGRDLVVVLHQKGSHGPAYAKRYPQQFGRFKPACATTAFEKCSRASIEAAYDNTILYTDFFLSRLIGLLRRIDSKDGVDSAMLYVSDHGESLGENNLYLHGAPYLIAPPEQIHVPMMLWMSGRFSERFRLDPTCLRTRRHLPLSHDNVFHSVLGMLDVRSDVYRPGLSLFTPCGRQHG
ncbi:MAG: phosphoethanolamine transferase [Massilia sp.]